TDYLPAVSVITGIAVVMERQSLYLEAVEMWKNAYAIVRDIGASKEWARMAAYLGRMADISATIYEEEESQSKDRDLTKFQSREIQILEWYGAKLEFLESYGNNNPDTSIHLPVNEEQVKTLASIAMFYI